MLPLLKWVNEVLLHVPKPYLRFVKTVAEMSHVGLTFHGPFALGVGVINLGRESDSVQQWSIAVS